MKILCIWIFIFFFATINIAQQSVPAFNDAPLRKVLAYLESNYDLVFSFRDQNVGQEMVSIEKGVYQVQNILDIIFQQTRLDFKLIDDRHIILTIKQLENSDPKKLCGTIKDKATGEILAYASVQIKGSNKGVSAEENGKFELSTESKNDIIIVSYLGYLSKEIPVEYAMEVPCRSFFLEVEGHIFEPVIVTEYLTTGIDQSDLGNSIIIRPKKLSVLPGSVEPDIMASIQMLPGIISPDETVSGIFIRGGTPDQNLVLYDGIPVFHTGHFFGMISAFNPYIIESVDVYRSGISTEFGGRVSGVIDIHSNSTIPDGFEMGAGFNFTHGHIDLGIPIAKNSAVFLSLRRSFTDFWSTPTFLNYAERVFQGTKIEDGNFQSQNLPVNDKFYFSDFNFKWVWNPGKSKFGITMFGGLNSLDYASEIPEWNAFTLDVLKLENGGFSMFWEKEWSKKFSSSLNFTYAEYDYNYNLSFSLIEEPDTALFSFSSLNFIKDEGISLINEWKPFKNQKIKFGYQFTENLIEVGLKTLGNNQSEVEEQFFENRLHTLFGEYNLNIEGILDLNLGLRFQRQTVLKNEYFEPRIALSTRINDDFKLKISSSKQFQFISQLIILGINDIGINNQIWIASDNQNIPVIESNQWAGGILFSKNDWTLDIEA